MKKLTKQEYNNYLKDFIANTELTKTELKFLYNEAIDNISDKRGYNSFAEFNDIDIAELMYEKIKVTSVSLFHVGRGVYTKLFNFLLEKEIISNNPCYGVALSLEAFTNYISWDESLKPYTREYICNAIDLNVDNRNYYDVIILSIYEGIFASYKSLSDFRYSDIKDGVIHTNSGDRIPSDRLLNSIYGLQKENEFIYTYKKGVLVAVDDRVVPYIMVKKSDVEHFTTDAEGRHRIQKSMYKLLGRFNDKNGTDFSQQKLWESGLINRVVDTLGAERFIKIMLNPTTDKAEHKELNDMLCNTYGWEFDNELAIDKFKTIYRYHAVRMKRELNL